MFVIFAALAVHPELGLFLVERERNRDVLAVIIVVTDVAGHRNACTTDIHLGPITLGDGVNAEHTVAAIRGKSGEEVQEEGG